MQAVLMRNQVCWDSAPRKRHVRGATLPDWLRQPAGTRAAVDRKAT